MSMAAWAWIAGAVLLIAIAALLAAAETAVTRLSGASVDEARREGVRGSARLQAIVDDRARYVNPLLLLHTVLQFAAVAAVTLAITGSLDWPLWASAGLSVLVASAVSYIVVGVFGRTLGRQHPLIITRILGGPIRAIAFLLGPLTRVLIVFGNVVTPGKGFRDGPFANQAELRELVDQAQEASLIEDDERQMIHSVFELGDTIAREVMVPRTEMVFIESHKTLRQALSLGLRSGFSRIPVIGENADDILGLLYLKDVLRRVFDSKDAEHTETVASIMREATFVPDSKDADDLLRFMQANRVHLAIVVDEFGGTAGLVAIEDILEEIVGEIADEYDTAAPEIAELEDNAYRVSSRLSIDTLADLLDIEIDADEEGVETVGGLLARRLGMVPIPGAQVLEQDWMLQAEAGAGRRNRIASVLCTFQPPDPSHDAGEDAGDAGRDRRVAKVKDEHVRSGSDSGTRNGSEIGSPTKDKGLLHGRTWR